MRSWAHLREPLCEHQGKASTGIAHRPQCRKLTADTTPSIKTVAITLAISDEQCFDPREFFETFRCESKRVSGRQTGSISWIRRAGSAGGIEYVATTPLVACAPSFPKPLHFVQRGDAVHVQAFVAQRNLESLDEAIVHRFGQSAELIALLQLGPQVLAVLVARRHLNPSAGPAQTDVVVALGIVQSVRL